MIKNSTNLTNLNRNKIFDDVADNSAKPDTLKKIILLKAVLPEV
jgi:hypothetical protein